MATMEDVARVAGVSITTVSHVLNGTRPVSDQTAERVRAAVAETGYSQSARAQSRTRTQTIGLAVSGLANPSFGELISAVEQAAGAAGHRLLLGDTLDEPQREFEIVEALLARRVDGLLLAPSAGAHAHALRLLAARSLPVVLLDRFADASFDQVGSENVEPTAELVDHLVAGRHSRIGIVVGAPELPTSLERLAGYELGLERNGLAFDPALARSGEAGRAAARDATRQLLDLRDPPTALISSSNAMTIGVMEALSERGLRVPADIALVAFDDFDWAEFFAPRLTVVAQPVAELGATAVELLLARLDDPARDPRSIRLPARFVHRDSCGCRPQR